MSTFGSSLESLLLEAGMKQSELADICGLTQAAISQLINGEREPALGTLLKICVGLKVTPNDLLGFHSKEKFELRNEVCQLRLRIDRAMRSLRDPLL